MRQDRGMTSRPASITRVDEYDGREEVWIAATQLGTDYSASLARKVVDEWVEFFRAGPSPIRELHFTSRTPARLFDALTHQVQLRRLEVKWGDYSDLGMLRPLTSLVTLTLRGASKVTDVAALGDLFGVRALAIEGFRHIDDPTPLGRLGSLTSLELGGNWMAPRNGHLPSIGFLRDLTELRELLLHTVVVDDKDYSPVLDLPKLEKVRIMAVRGMNPPIEELKGSLPWNG
jgi:hypothetical protein